METFLNGVLLVVSHLHSLFSDELIDSSKDLGGEDAPDYVRGPYNEGGWWFERVGAHLVCAVVNTSTLLTFLLAWIR